MTRLAALSDEHARVSEARGAILAEARLLWQHVEQKAWEHRERHDQIRESLNELLTEMVSGASLLERSVHPGLLPHPRE